MFPRVGMATDIEMFVSGGFLQSHRLHVSQLVLSKPLDISGFVCHECVICKYVQAFIVDLYLDYFWFSVEVLNKER